MENTYTEIRQELRTSLSMCVIPIRVIENSLTLSKSWGVAYLSFSAPLFPLLYIYDVWWINYRKRLSGYWTRPIYSWLWRWIMMREEGSVPTIIPTIKVKSIRKKTEKRSRRLLNNKPVDCIHALSHFPPAKTTIRTVGTSNLSRCNICVHLARKLWVCWYTGIGWLLLCCSLPLLDFMYDDANVSIIQSTHPLGRLSITINRTD